MPDPATLEARRVALGVSYRELAELMGLTGHAGIQRALTGKGNPTHKTLQRIEAALDQAQQQERDDD